jgi:competence protein ComEC
MAKKFLNEKTHRFSYTTPDGQRSSYILLFGDEANVLPGAAPSGAGWERVEVRGRTGEMQNTTWTTQRALEMYFLDVGQGDAAFLVTPRGKKILVDGGLQNRALGFLIWKYRLDEPGTSVHIDLLVLSHGDADHVEGLIPVLQHPKITVGRIVHNGIAVYDSGFATALGDRDTAGDLETLHSSVADLNGTQLEGVFADWITAVRAEGVPYASVDMSTGTIDVGDPTVQLEVLGPALLPGKRALPWFGNKSETINGHSVAFRLTYRDVRAFFSGDLNTEGSRYLLDRLALVSRFDAHIFKAPHHGSHDYHQPLFAAIRPMITVVSSGNSPDHGHPRAQFLGGVGLAGRGATPLVFSTEIAATFVDAGDAAAVPAPVAGGDGDIDVADLDFATSEDNTLLRRRFKQTLPGIINVRTDGRVMYAARHVQAAYQWESYGPITPV